MTGRDDPVVAVADLSHRYGKTVALDGVSLAIPRGGFVGVIGPDGVGKSTLFGLIAGAKRIQAGRISVLGGDMADRAASLGSLPAHRLHAAGARQEPLPRPQRPREHRLLRPAVRRGTADRERRIALLLEATGLAPFPDRPAKKLSGGMRQKLGLCCALVHDPELLILDEPTTGVDPLSRRQFWELIDRMRAEHPGMSILVATAYSEEAERFESLLAMNAGRILAAGSPAEIKALTGQETSRRASSRSCPRPPAPDAQRSASRRGRCATMMRSSSPATSPDGLASSSRWTA